MFKLGDKIRSSKNGKVYTVQHCGAAWVKVAESTKQLELSVHAFVKE